MAIQNKFLKIFLSTKFVFEMAYISSIFSIYLIKKNKCCNDYKINVNAVFQFYILCEITNNLRQS